MSTPEKVEVACIEGGRSQSPDRASIEKADDDAAISWTRDEENAALKKLDWNLIPL